MHYIIFLIPFVISFLVKDPIISYLVSWGGSIFLVAFSIYLYQKDNGGLKFFKPIILAQVLFWSYAGITSIFYFVDQLGFEFLEQVRYPDLYELEILAKAQNFVVLGHGAYLIGFFLVRKKITEQKYIINVTKYGYLKLSLVTLGIGIAVSIGPFAQLASYLNVFSTICAVKFFGDALKKRKLIIPSLAYFLLILVYGFVSGMKESTLFPLIILGVTLYDHFGLAKTSVFIVPVFVAYFYFIPTMNNEVRNLNWGYDRSVVETITLLNKNNILNEDNISNNNWAFLTRRLSEASMLNRYIESVPSRRPFYHLGIFWDAARSMVPRFLSPNKESPDVTAQRRAIENGALVLNYGDTATSAKPQTVADAYMSDSYLGVIITFLIFGFLTNYLAIDLESKFGYNFGITILFYTLYLVFTRGGCFENLFGSVLYGFILSHCITFIFEKFTILEKVEED